MSRFVDRGAIYAGWVGVGMAMTIAVSFLLVVPIEPVFWLMAPFAGLIIGYYANSRAGRTERRGRMLINGLYAGLLTAVTLAALFLVTKAIFFAGDNGYRDASSGGPLSCTAGADCVYQRYLAENRGPSFEAAGIRTVDDFTAFYWREQLGTAGTVLLLCTVAGLVGAGLYALVRPKQAAAEAAAAAAATASQAAATAAEAAAAAATELEEARAGAVPSWFGRTLVEAGASGASIRASRIAGSRAAAFVAVVPGDRAIAALDALRAAAPAGWVALLHGDPDTEGRLAAVADAATDSVARILAAAARLDPVAVVEGFTAGDAPLSPERAGAWPGKPADSMGFTLQLDATTGVPRPTLISAIAAADPAEIPAVLGWGGWNACPEPAVHVALFRHWHETHGAELAGISEDILELRVARPPRTREDALALARDLDAYSPDVVDQGLETVANLGSTLLDSPVWFFWWD